MIHIINKIFIIRILLNSNAPNNIIFSNSS